MKSYEFNFATEKGQQLCYIHLYLLLNGVLEIDKLLEILKSYHNFNIDKDELLELVKELYDDVDIMGKYICIMGIERNLAHEIMRLKDLLGTYKIIDELDEIEEQFNENVRDINDICNEFFDNNNAFEMIRSIMFLRGISSDMLSDTLKTNKIVLSNYDKRLLFRKLEKCQKNVRVWVFNGFTKDEFSKLAEMR